MYIKRKIALHLEPWIGYVPDRIIQISIYSYQVVSSVYESVSTLSDSIHFTCLPRTCQNLVYGGTFAILTGNDNSVPVVLSKTVHANCTWTTQWLTYTIKDNGSCPFRYPLYADFFFGEITYSKFGPWINIVHCPIQFHTEQFKMSNIFWMHNVVSPVYRRHWQVLYSGITTPVFKEGNYYFFVIILLLCYYCYYHFFYCCSLHGRNRKVTTLKLCTENWNNRSNKFHPEHVTIISIQTVSRTLSPFRNTTNGMAPLAQTVTCLNFQYRTFRKG